MKLFDWFRLKEEVKYFVEKVEPRKGSDGNYGQAGWYITVRFEKTLTQFGRSETIVRTEKFDNYHRRNDGWTYNPHDFGNDGWNLLINNDCEEYPFAPMNSQWLRDRLEEWAIKNGVIFEEDTQ